MQHVTQFLLLGVGEVEEESENQPTTLSKVVKNRCAEDGFATAWHTVKPQMPTRTNLPLMKVVAI